MLGGVIEFTVSAIDLKTLILGNGSYCWSPDFTDGHIPEGVICSKSLSKLVMELEIETESPVLSAKKVYHGRGEAGEQRKY